MALTFLVLKKSSRVERKHSVSQVSITRATGKANFFTSNLGGGWRSAGGIRWLQLNDIRTLWFITPDPHNPNLVAVRSIEEKVYSPALAAALKVNPEDVISQSEH